MEMEIAEQKNIIPYILMKYIDSQTGEIKLTLPSDIRKIVFMVIVISALILILAL